MIRTCEVCGEKVEGKGLVDFILETRPDHGFWCDSCLEAQADLLDETGSVRNLPQGMVLHRAIVERKRRNQSYKCAVQIGKDGMALFNEGKYEEALPCFNRATEVFRALGELRDLSACLGNTAVILAELGRYMEALTLHKEEEHICRQQGDDADLAVCFYNEGRLQKKLGNIKSATKLCKKAIKLLKRTAKYPKTLRDAETFLSQLRQ